MQSYRERNNADDGCKDLVTAFVKGPAEVSGSRGHRKPSVCALHDSHHSPCSCCPFADLPPLSQGQPSNGHLRLVISQLYWSHVVNSPKTLPLELLSEELMNYE